MTKKKVGKDSKVDDTDKIPAELLDVLAAQDDDLPMLPPLQTIARYNKSTDTAKIPNELLEALDDTYIPPSSPMLDDEPPVDDSDTAKVIPLRE